MEETESYWKNLLRQRPKCESTRIQYLFRLWIYRWWVPHLTNEERKTLPAQLSIDDTSKYVDAFRKSISPLFGVSERSCNVFVCSLRKLLLLGHLVDPKDVLNAAMKVFLEKQLGFTLLKLFPDGSVGLHDNLRMFYEGFCRKFTYPYNLEKIKLWRHSGNWKRNSVLKELPEDPFEALFDMDEDDESCYIKVDLLEFAREIAERENNKLRKITL